MPRKINLQAEVAELGVYLASRKLTPYQVLRLLTLTLGNVLWRYPGSLARREALSWAVMEAIRKQR
jgi:hypothetical protein